MIMVELIVLFVVLAAQVYSIVRSETLLRREREIHGKVEKFLEGLTPAGLWSQYENLKKFYDDLQESLKAKTEALHKVEAELTEVKNENLSAATQIEHFRVALQSYSELVRSQLQEAHQQIKRVERDADRLKRWPLARGSSYVAPTAAGQHVDPTYMVEAEKGKQRGEDR